MTNQSCPVRSVADYLSGALSSGGLSHPWSRQRAVEVWQLVEDISRGRGGPRHWPALLALSRSLEVDSPDPDGRNLGIRLNRTLTEAAEVFQSHLETGNCPGGACARLTPAPCQLACPAGIDIPSYVTLIGQGRDAEAIELIRRDNPFPWICGLICTNPCELMCVRGRIDRPVAIKTLKGFAAERSMSHRQYVNPERAASNGRRVCVIGAGPAGLTGAYYLALKGYRVTVIDGLPTAGGMMMVGIPRYRLPREVIDLEVARIEELGVEFRFNTYLGQDVTIESLRTEGFEAFLVAMGAHSCLALHVPGERDFRQMTSAVDLLRNVALGDRHLPGKKVAVIGGGNVAIDAARTCLRLGAEEVTLVYRRTRGEMPANPEEIEQAEEEGIGFLFLTMPVRVVGRNRDLTGLECLRTELGPPDAGGRRKPVSIEGSNFVLEVDAIIPAIGQAIHPGGLNHLHDMKWSRRGTIMVDTASMATAAPGIFAAGDIVTGPATVVEAIGGGKKAAQAIDRYLTGLPQPQMPPAPVRRGRLDCIEVSAATKMILKRPHQGVLNMDRRRVTFQQVELGLTENEVREEARRCLRCDICQRCGTCVAICRDQMTLAALDLGHLDFDHPVATDFRTTAEKCILCGACANNCPTGAMDIHDREGERRLLLCGTVLNRQKLDHCASCGAVLGPKPYRAYVARQIDTRAPLAADRDLCPNCARHKGAWRHAESVAPPTNHQG